MPTFRLTSIAHDRLIGAMDTVSSYAYTYSRASEARETARPKRRERSVSVAPTSDASRARRARRPASRQRERERSASEVPTFQRVRVDEVDGTYWLYSYDGLGQVTGGTSRPRASGGDGPPRNRDGGSGAPATRQLAADGSILPGHDFGYAYDDIGQPTPRQRGRRPAQRAGAERSAAPTFRTTATTDATNRPRASGGDSPPRNRDGGSGAPATRQLAATIPTRTEAYTANLLSRAKRDGQHDCAGTERSGVPTSQYEQRTVPSDEEVLGSAAADADVYVNQQPALRKDELFYAQVAGDNAAAADAPDVRIDAIKPGAGPNGEDIASTEEGQLFIPQTPEVFSYDADGNMTGDGRWIYTWNGENRLIQLETDPAVWTEVNGAIERQKFLFAYDHIGRRTTKQVYTWDSQTADWTLTTSLRFIYDAWNLLAELEPTDYEVDPASFQYQVTRSYVWGLDLSNTLQGAGGVGGLLLATNSESTTLPLCDGNGNVMQYAASGHVMSLSSYTYSPFGGTIVADGDARYFSFRFSTKYADESNLIYYGLRLYCIKRGRWLNRDPLTERVAAEEIHSYCYIFNEPITFYDYLGLKRKIPWEEYWIYIQRLKPDLDKNQLAWAERQLARGCVGVTAVMTGRSEDLTNCWTFQNQARCVAARTKCDIGSAKVFSVHLWNNTGQDGINPDVTFDPVTGKADLSNWDKKARPGGYVNFDFGFLTIGGNLVHADQYHNPDRDGDGVGDYYKTNKIRNATIYVSNLKEWQNSYVDFNTEVWCVECEGNYGN